MFISSSSSKNACDSNHSFSTSSKASAGVRGTGGVGGGEGAEVEDFGGRPRRLVDDFGDSDEGSDDSSEDSLSIVEEITNVERFKFVGCFKEENLGEVMETFTTSGWGNILFIPLLQRVMDGIENVWLYEIRRDTNTTM